MSMNRIVFCLLVVALLMAFVPLRPTNPVQPCPYTYRYAISFSEPPTNYLDPEDIYPGYPSLCTDLLPSYRAIL